MKINIKNNLMKVEKFIPESELYTCLKTLIKLNILRQKDFFEIKTKENAEIESMFVNSMQLVLMSYSNIYDKSTDEILNLVKLDFEGSNNN